MEEKRKGRKDPELAKIAQKLFSLRRKRERELMKMVKNEDLIKKINEEIEEWINAREAYHEAHRKERTTYPRTKPTSGYYTIRSSPKSDAKLAEELHYPDVVIGMLLRESDEKKRMRILEKARLGSYGKRGAF